ncbi:patatin-like phospholipase family protein [Ktedonosporobacter rubrisoli]|uniref:Patatin-like phospholipase family protein n=1 Tax=Ktedonosporobacter rubrisoli TaxID=2509675 RepID=A0A4P6JJN7_KTERU|nr:patatin-like phospholipase family protein [Ktedonosporobacter rubrisoli]QBD75329.1 patatin-like phospholipase family protein [Ktedonosporobacter rubrisoli]
MTTRTLAAGGGGVAGIAWEMGLLVGLAEAGIDVRLADLFLGTSAGSAVTAQITSGRTMEELFQRQVDPVLQAKELPANADFQQLIADFTRIFKEGGSSNAILQKVGALALSTPTVAEAERRDVIVSRLPVHHWPQARLEIVATDAESGERIVFTRESGVELIDAVAASCAVPCVWPPVTIGKHRYIDGGCYSMANVDLATGFDKVLVLQPDIPPIPVLESLDEQIERLRLGGTQVEVLTPDEAVKLALAKAGGNALDPSLRGIAARGGREQARRELARVAAFWG